MPGMRAGKEANVAAGGRDFTHDAAREALTIRLGRAFSELASHRDTMPVSAISRGSEQLRQAVLAFNGGSARLFARRAGAVV